MSRPRPGVLRLADIDMKRCADFLHGIVDGVRYYAKAEHNRVVLTESGGMVHAMGKN